MHNLLCLLEFNDYKQLNIDSEEPNQTLVDYLGSSFAIGEKT